MSGVQSVERAVAILRALTTGPARVTELAARTHLPKSTVSRLLSTLEGLEAVEQSGNGGPYRLGRLAEEIGAATGPTRALPELAQPFLAELSLLTGEAAGLSVREGAMVRYLAQTTPRTRSRSGTGPVPRSRPTSPPRGWSSSPTSRMPRSTRSSPRRSPPSPRTPSPTPIASGSAWP